MASSFTRNAVVLGLLSAVGPFAIDMYLPALPAISADLHASTSATQMTLIAFFVSFGLCQIVYGPLSDVCGRKLPLYVGLTLFILGAIGCALSPTVGWLIACRFLQRFGAAMGVIPRAIIRDLHTGAEATRLMSLVMLVFSVSPIRATDRQRADRTVRLARSVRRGRHRGGDRAVAGRFPAAGNASGP
jgi:DHA1 family bicyclomycin/chloramphenicol resistance-like MFS transporter